MISVPFPLKWHTFLRLEFCFYLFSFPDLFFWGIQNDQILNKSRHLQELKKKKKKTGIFKCNCSIRESSVYIVQLLGTIREQNDPQSLSEHEEK